MKKFFIFSICLISSISTVFASMYPEANFGEYGLEHFSNADGYQKYVGQTVAYMSKKRAYGADYEFTSELNGKIGVPYIIKKVSGHDDIIVFEMIEKENHKKKLKFRFKNNDNYSIYNYRFANAENFRVPLFLIDKFNQDVAELPGKTINVQDKNFITIKKVYLHYPEDCYPIPYYEIENPLSKTTYNVPISLINKYASIVGKVYSDPECNFNLTIIDYKEEKTTNVSFDNFYIFLNSATGKTVEFHGMTFENETSSFGLDPIVFAEKQFAIAKDGHYNGVLSKVIKPSNPNIRYGKTAEIKDDNITKYSYADNIIDIAIFNDSTKFFFSLKNISSNSIKIIWDDAAFVDANGTASKIIHDGTKYTERNSIQTPTTVLKDAKIVDCALPSDRVYYNESQKKWTSRSMMPKEPKLKGKQIKLMLPIQIKDVVNEYIFVLDLNYELDHPELLINPEV